MIDLTQEEIMMHWRKQASDMPLVSVRCLAYNHELYIEQALDGFLMQKTNFPFEVIVHDDASTDRTAEIIREYEAKYPKIIKPIYEMENQFKKKGGIIQKKMHSLTRGKYVAICEGDDYWCIESKLQLQADFMEAHPEYSLCITNSYRLDCATGLMSLMNPFDMEGEIPLRTMVEHSLAVKYPATASYFMPTKIFLSKPKKFITNAFGDLPTRLWACSNGKCFYFQEPMCVYRVAHSGSYMTRLSSDKSRYVRHILALIQFYGMFNTFTKKEFSSVLEPKIDDWVYALCASLRKSELRKLRLWKKYSAKLLACIKLCRPENLPCRGTKRMKEHRIYIFGTGYLACVCYRQLVKKHIIPDGFVISDGYAKNARIIDAMFPTRRRHPSIFYLSELPITRNIEFIVAIQPNNAKPVLKELESMGVVYHTPYKPLP